MKARFGILALVVVLATSACADKTTNEKKEVIVVPVKVKETKTFQDPTEKKPTSIVLDDKGVKVETKKVDVVIKKP